MVKLAETTNVTLRRKLRKADGTEFYEIPAIGDGNCAFNAFALGLIAAIKQGQQIEQNTLDAFIDVIQKNENLEILKQRVALYRGQTSMIEGNQYTDLADKLENFISLWNANDANLIDFINNQNSQIEIAALHVALAPALRELSCNAREAENNALANNITPQREDGADAGNDDFFVLAKTFNLNVDVHQVTNKTKNEIQSQSNQEPIDPTKHTIQVLHTGNHWNLLLPPAEKAVFAQLPDLTATSPHVSDSASKKELTNKDSLQAWRDTPKLSAVDDPIQKTNAEKADKFRRANELMTKLDASNSQFGKFFDELSGAVKENNDKKFKKAEDEIQMLITPPRSKL